MPGGWGLQHALPNTAKRMVIVLSFYVLTAYNWTFLNVTCALSSITLSVIGTHSKQMLLDSDTLLQKMCHKKTAQGFALSFAVVATLIWLKPSGHHVEIKEISDRCGHCAFFFLLFVHTTYTCLGLPSLRP